MYLNKGWETEGRTAADRNQTADLYDQRPKKRKETVSFCPPHLLSLPLLIRAFE